jgi:hypothetical protein
MTAAPWAALVVLLALVASALPAHAQDVPPPPQPAAPAPAADDLDNPEPAAQAQKDETTAQAGLPPSDEAARYVVWRIKAGTGGGALAPRLERALRREMENRLGPEMLSKAAQTGIILVRPELADCDANLPCALDVAEALHIRFIIGGEAVSVAETTVTGWVIDRDRGAEVRRVSVKMEGQGKEAETAAVARLAEQLTMQERLGAADDERARASAPAQASGGGGVPVWRRMMGSGLTGVGALLGAVAVAVGVAGAAGLGMGITFAVLRSQYHTRAAQTAMLGTLVGGGAGLSLAVLFVVCALPMVALGVMAFAGIP